VVVEERLQGPLEFTKFVNLSDDIPAAPAYLYKDKGWVSMRNWLGYD